MSLLLISGIAAAGDGLAVGLQESLRQSAAPVEFEQITASAACSSGLSTMLNSLSDESKLSTIQVVPAAAAARQEALAFRGWNQNGALFLTRDLLAELRLADAASKQGPARPNDLAFTLGYLAADLVAQAEHAAARQQAQQKLQAAIAEANRTGAKSIDPTASFMAYRDAELAIASKAWINGWNAMIECGQAKKGNPLTQTEAGELMALSRYGAVFTRAASGGLALSEDGRISATTGNIKIFMEALGGSAVVDIR